MLYLHVIPSVTETALSEQPVRNYLMDIKFIKHWIGVLRYRCKLKSMMRWILFRAYLAQTGGEYHNLVNFSHLQQELIYAWTLENVKVMPVILDFHGNDKVSLLDRLRVQ